MNKFSIKYNEKIVNIELKNSAKVKDLKFAIQKEFNIPLCRQLVIGLKTQDEDSILSNSIINKENNLEVQVKSSDGGVDSSNDQEVTERLSGTYTLNINYNGQLYNLKFRGTTTVLEVKSGIYALTNIEVRNQIWNEWPPNATDQTLLAFSGINFPEHNFILSKISMSSSSGNKERDYSSMPTKIDSDEEEFEDASESFNVDDDYFVEDITPRKMEPLIPDNVEDEIVGSLTFIERFSNRYGPIHPAFFQGTLEEAIQEAFNKTTRERKILGIYLHHDSSVLTNVFCTQLLGFESVMQIFENSFILWGWDVSFESNSNKLEQSLKNNLGVVAASSIKSMPLDRLPAIILIMRIRSSTDIFNVVHGNVGVNELLSSLIEAVEVFSNHQKVEAKEEQERAEREMVKWEQDQAYRESLEADRAKEEARRSKEEAEREARVKMETEYAEEVRRREEYRMELERELPAEPPLGQGDKNAVTQIRFRLPQGKNLERRFHVTTPLKVLLDFLIVKGYTNEEYKVISGWPRIDLTTEDKTKTLKELKLCPQETVILEKR